MFRGDFPPEETKDCALLCICSQEENKNSSILHYAILLTKECDRNVPSTSAGSLLPCPSLWNPFLISFMPHHIPPAETSFLLLCYLQDTTQSLSLFCPVTPHIL